MKTVSRLAVVVLTLASGALHAETPPSEPSAEAPTSEKLTRHQQLCSMLGLRIGEHYEFMLSSNDQVHYWQIRSLGGNGWILAQDSRFAATWVNLNQITAVTRISPAPTPERQKKPNRER